MQDEAIFVGRGRESLESDYDSYSEEDLWNIELLDLLFRLFS